MMNIKFRELSVEELEYLVVGSNILGCGGGGSVEVARKMVKQIEELGKKPRLVSLEEVSDEAVCAIVGVIGGGLNEEEKELSSSVKETINDPMIEAVSRLEKYLNLTRGIKEIEGIFASEIGPENVLIPLLVATQMNKYVIDGDACGRAKPEVSISTTHVAGLPIAPLAVVSRVGDIVIIEEVQDDFRAETLLRSLAIVAGGEIGCCRCATRGRELKRAIVPGTLSLAIKLGKKIEEARTHDQNPITIIKEVLEAQLIFEGYPIEISRIEEGGFVVGKIEVRGAEDTPFADQSVTVKFKNEYLAVTAEKKLLASVPDSILIVDSRSGEGLSPWEDDFKDQSRRVSILVKKAWKLWYSEKGLDLFSLEHFGLSQLGRRRRTRRKEENQQLF